MFGWKSNILLSL